MNKTLYIVLFLCSCLMAGCSQSRQFKRTTTDPFDLLYKLEPQWRTERILALCDSLEQTGDFAPIVANHYRAVAYTKHNQTEPAIPYLQKVIDVKPKSAEERQYHLMAMGLMVDALTVSHRYEQILTLALPYLEQMDWSDVEKDRDCASAATRMLFNVGFCHVALNRYDEAELFFHQGLDRLEEAIDRDSARLTNHWGNYLCNDLQSVGVAYLNANQFERAKPWVDRYVEAANQYAAVPNANKPLVDLQIFYSHLMKATVYQHIGQKEEAAAAFEQCMSTESAQTPANRINASNYLLLVGRYAEAADYNLPLEDLMKAYGMDWTIETINEFLTVKFKANYGAGRRDSALAVANRLVCALDSAVIWQNRDKAAELATIYDTQGKERQIAEQKNALLQQRLVSLAIALALIVIFFTIYTINRRRHAQRMAEMKAAQERIESELRIARDIQMSMVPSVFPDYEGLDMYASMSPAREVGGDLYGYVLQGDKLYFALGDVSGKGVPASLFMAQATRLFSTLAKQDMMPAEICTRMNDALSGNDNESGMFVTFFLGLVDLKTGHLDFCNAGHNPPVIGMDNGQLAMDNDGAQQKTASNCQLSIFNYQFMNMLPNAPIGLWPGLKYEGEEIDSIKGCPLFIYTDGLNEAENLQQEQFGDDRLLDILRSIHFESSKQVVETLAAEVEKHRNGAEPNDDLTMMCLKL